MSVHQSAKNKLEAYCFQLDIKLILFANIFMPDFFTSGGKKCNSEKKNQVQLSLFISNVLFECRNIWEYTSKLYWKQAPRILDH